ncbi:hypothetical protein BBJ28_00022181 [Nothophytophthora sp. Chile5]|nr:hypothetical protein BBJ28_00022181 [Nothophytophthora sp. Chile5]
MGRDRESDEDFAPAEDEDDGAAGIPVPGESAQAQELVGAIAEPPLEEKAAQTVTSVQAAKEPTPSQSTGARRKQGRKRLDPSGKPAPPPAVKPGTFGSSDTDEAPANLQKKPAKQVAGKTSAKGKRKKVSGFGGTQSRSARETRHRSAKKAKRSVFSPHETDWSSDEAPSVDTDSDSEAIPVIKETVEGGTDWTTPRSPEYIPRQRKSKNAETIQKMLAGRTHVSNRVAPVPRKAYTSWDELEKVVGAHEREHYLLFRRRSSVTTELYNSRSDDKIPAAFEYSWKKFLCTHGVYIASRGKGERNHPTRFTGCNGRFEAKVINRASSEDPPDWRIVIYHEVSGTWIGVHLFCLILVMWELSELTLKLHE